MSELKTDWVRHEENKIINNEIGVELLIEKRSIKAYTDVGRFQMPFKTDVRVENVIEVAKRAVDRSIHKQILQQIRA